MTKTNTDIEKFQYDHIFYLILGIFKFSEKKLKFGTEKKKHFLIALLRIPATRKNYCSSCFEIRPQPTGRDTRTKNKKRPPNVSLYGRP